MPSGRASRRDQLAVLTGWSTTPSGAYDPAQALRSDGGRLTPPCGACAPATQQAHLSGHMAAANAEEVQRGMLSAYVLIEIEIGKVVHVAKALKDLDGVEVAEDLAGPYDVIARVQAPGLDQLGRLVASRIQAVDGVTRTLTCTVIHR
jgi:DNA-binding Lrp family transcriptional regulator